MTPRRKEPQPAELLEFIADHESLQLCCDEFPSVSEERLRQQLREIAHSIRTSTNHTTTGKAASRPATATKGMMVEIYTDGASRGNPGPAGAGWVIRAQDKTLLQEGNAFLGQRTNNEAEYEAVLHSLKAAAALGAAAVSLRSDSELLVRQINGQYKVRNQRLLRLHQAVRDLAQVFRRFDVRHVPRDENSAADQQANRAIDDALR